MRHPTSPSGSTPTDKEGRARVTQVKVCMNTLDPLKDCSCLTLYMEPLYLAFALCIGLTVELYGACLLSWQHILPGTKGLNVYVQLEACLDRSAVGPV